MEGRSGQNQDGVDTHSGFFLMQAVDILRGRRGQPISSADLQSQIGFTTANAPVLLKKLMDMPQVHFDARTKSWVYIPPLTHVNTIEKLLEEVSKPEHLFCGFQVTTETLEIQGMQALIRECIEHNLCRVIRTGKNLRCRRYSPDSGFFCDIRDKDRCDNCGTVLGLSLYAFEKSRIESSAKFLAPDIRELWNEVKMPDAVTFATEIAGKEAGDGLVDLTGITKRKRRLLTTQGRKPATKAKRIVNLHIYTAEEYKEELVRVMAEEG